MALIMEKNGWMGVCFQTFVAFMGILQTILHGIVGTSHLP
jgi:hypothetical protein